MRATDTPAAAPATTPTLGELDGGLVSLSEALKAPVGCDEVPVLVRESSGGSKGSDVELLWEVNKPEVLAVLPEDTDSVEVELDESAGVDVVEAEPRSGVELTGLEPGG
jgi:hypothetical protein